MQVEGFVVNNQHPIRAILIVINNLQEVIVSAQEYVPLGFVVLNLRQFTTYVKLNLLFLIDFRCTVDELQFYYWSPGVFCVELSFYLVLVLLRLRQLKSKPESAAALESGLNADISSKLVDDSLGYIQAETNALYVLLLS